MDFQTTGATAPDADDLDLQALDPDRLADLEDYAADFGPEATKAALRAWKPEPEPADHASAQEDEPTTTTEPEVTATAITIIQPVSLPELAQMAREGLRETLQGEFHVVEGHLKTIEALGKARDRFGLDDNRFGAWVNVEVGRLDPHRRAAYVGMYRDLELARDVLENTDSKSIRLIYENEFLPRYGNVAIPPTDAEPEEGGEGNANQQAGSTRRKPTPVELWQRRANRLAVDLQRMAADDVIDPVQTAGLIDAAVQLLNAQRPPAEAIGGTEAEPTEVVVPVPPPAPKPREKFQTAWEAVLNLELALRMELHRRLGDLIARAQPLPPPPQEAAPKDDGLDPPPFMDKRSKAA